MDKTSDADKSVNYIRTVYKWTQDTHPQPTRHTQTHTQNHTHSDHREDSSDQHSCRGFSQLKITY